MFWLGFGVGFVTAAVLAGVLFRLMTSYVR
jgi:hypothetical protein